MRPSLLVLDVNETLSDMSPLAARFEDVGAPAHLMETWFAAVLRDGFALAASGGYADFGRVAESAAISLLAAQEPRFDDLAAAARHVLAGFAELTLHDDVRPALERLAAARVPVVTLTNGARSTAVELLERGGVTELVEANLSVEQPARWKPAAEAYHYALGHCGVEPRHAMLVAVHPWDIDGAKRAGMRGGWINRSGVPYPPVMQSPDVSARDFTRLVDTLLELA